MVGGKWINLRTKEKGCHQRQWSIPHFTHSEYKYTHEHKLSLPKYTKVDDSELMSASHQVDITDIRSRISDEISNTL